MTTALVIGAGIAGPVAAMALQKAGIHAELFEGHPTGADEIGSWLTLQANGIDALAAVDAQHVVSGVGFPQPSMRFLSGSGRVLGRMSNGAPLADGTPTQMCRAAGSIPSSATRPWHVGRPSPTAGGSSTPRRRAPG